MLQEWKAMEKPEEEEVRVRLAADKRKVSKAAAFDQRAEDTGTCAHGRLGNRRKRFRDRSGDPEYRSAFLQGGINGRKE